MAGLAYQTRVSAWEEVAGVVSGGADTCVCSTVGPGVRG